MEKTFCPLINQTCVGEKCVNLEIKTFKIIPGYASLTRQRPPKKVDFDKPLYLCNYFKIEFSENDAKVILSSNN